MYFEFLLIAKLKLVLVLLDHWNQAFVRAKIMYQYPCHLLSMTDHHLVVCSCLVWRSLPTLGSSEVTNHRRQPHSFGRLVDLFFEFLLITKLKLVLIPLDPWNQAFVAAKILYQYPYHLLSMTDHHLDVCSCLV